MSTVVLIDNTSKTLRYQWPQNLLSIRACDLFDEKNPDDYQSSLNASNQKSSDRDSLLKPNLNDVMQNKDYMSRESPQSRP